MKYLQIISQNNIKKRSIVFIVRIHVRVRRGSICDRVNVRNEQLETGTDAPRTCVTIRREMFSELVVV